MEAATVERQLLTADGRGAAARAAPCSAGQDGVARPRAWLLRVAGLFVEAIRAQPFAAVCRKPADLRATIR